jgi:hypothetical protein
MRCHSVALPSSAEYCPIGDTTMRFGRGRPRNVYGENKTDGTYHAPDLND